MQVSFKRTFLLVVLALILLVGLLGWTLRAMASSAMYHSTSFHSSHADSHHMSTTPKKLLEDLLGGRKAVLFTFYSPLHLWSPDLYRSIAAGRGN